MSDCEFLNIAKLRIIGRVLNSFAKNISTFDMMRFLLKFLDFLVVSNIYVALGVLALTWISQELNDIENTNLLFFVFASTIFAYNFVRLFRVHPMLLEGESIRHHSIFRLRYLLWIICIASGIWAFYLFLKFDNLVSSLIYFMAALSIAYAIPIYKKKGNWIRLRDVPGIKIFLIAFVWTLVTVSFPVLEQGAPFRFLEHIERFLFVFAITIPFDIRDMRFDDFSLSTIPQILGIRKSRWIGIGALLFAELILAYRFFFEDAMGIWQALAIYLTYELAALLVYKSHPQLPERYVTLGVEGVSILMGLLFFLSQLI